MSKFNTLAQANVDHYNDHPVAHTAVIAVLAVGGVVLINKMAKRLGREDPAHLKSGHMAR